MAKTTKKSAVKKTTKKPSKKTAAPLERYEEPVSYELMLIVQADISDEEIQTIVSTIKDEIKSSKGEITHEDNWGIRDLAYRIKKQNKGYYEVIYMTILPSAVKELQNSLQLNQKILRFGMFKTPKGYTTKPLTEYDIDEEEVKKEKKERINQGKRPKYQRVVKKEEKKEKEEKPEEEKEIKKEQTKEEESKKEVKKEEKPKEEETKEVKEEKAADKKDDDKEAKKEPELSDIDSKLEKILEDPDLNITL